MSLSLPIPCGPLTLYALAALAVFQCSVLLLLPRDLGTCSLSVLDAPSPSQCLLILQVFAPRKLSLIAYLPQFPLSMEKGVSWLHGALLIIPGLG